MQPAWRHAIGVIALSILFVLIATTLLYIGARVNHRETSPKNPIESTRR